ncbi:MAG: class I SAM-dependent methyltransferase [Patescibacteria group bacterium]
MNNIIPGPEKFPEKYLELDEKTSEFPIPEEVWEEVISLAKEEEEGKEIGEKGWYGKIPLDSLLDLAKCVREEIDPVKRYEILTKKSPDGQIWFDVLAGLRSLPAQEELIKTVSRKKWDKALDLGTGTGEVADKIKPYCRELVGIDRVKLLLDLAQKRKTKKQEYVLADALKSPFKKNSFELVVSSGLTGSFTK